MPHAAVGTLKSSRLRWIYHVVRMDEIWNAL